ncbi:MAG: class I SAM-dependent methyltransferase [Saprospiraceae bacterium]|nr:class I SAM-dependent methyltransferase [Saprospiraceae bacterium]
MIPRIWWMFFLISSCSYFDKNGPLILKEPAHQEPNENAEKSFEAFEFSDRTIWQKPFLIIDLLEPLDQKVVADIGAGSGYFTFRFIHKAKKVIAVEIDSTLIELMNAEKDYYDQELQRKYEARLATPDDSKLKDDEVDIVFISNTYTYLENRMEYLKNLKPKLKADGILVIVDFKKKMTPIGPPLDQRLAQGDVESELVLAGYHIAKSDDISLEYQYIIIAEPNP